MLSWLHSEVTNVVSVVSAVFHTPSFAEHFISKLKKYGNTVVDIEDGFLTFEIKENSLGFVDTTGQVHILQATWEEELAVYIESIRSKIVYIDHGDLSEVWEEADFRAYKNELVAQGLIERGARVTFHDLEINQTITFDTEVELELYLKWVTRYGRPDEAIKESPAASRFLTGSLAVSGAFVGAGMLRGIEKLATKVSFGHGFVAAHSLVLSCAHVVTGNPGMFALAALVSFTEHAPVAAALDTYGWNTTFAEVLSSRAYGNAETTYLAGTASTGYAVAGGSGLDAKIMLLDSEFGLTWGHMLNESVSFDIAGIARTTDQGLVVVGGTTLGTGNGDGIVLKVSAAGEKVFAKTIGDTDQNSLTAVAATTDGGFITAGHNVEYSSAWLYSSSLTSLTGVRSFHDTIALDGKIYVIGGNEDSSGAALESVLVYDVATDVWTSRGSMLSPAYYTASVSLDGKIYVLGGRANSADFDAVREYNPTTDAWSSKTQMSIAKRHFAIAVADGKIYIFGGYSDGAGYLDTVEMYDPSTDSWSFKAPMAIAREGARAVTVDGKIYIIGGQSSSGAPDDVVEEYDPISNSWETKASMLTARNYHSAVVIEGKIYVLGGVDASDTRLKSVEVYDPVTDAWSLHNSLATAKYVFATNLGSRIYIVGGYDGSYISAVESYTPTIGPRAILAKLSTSGLLEWSKKYYLTQTSINNVVPITGGYVALGSAELTDGSTHMLLIKTDSTGTVTLSRTYGITYSSQEGSQIVVTATGYVMTGYSQDTGYGVIVKVTTSGTVLWSKQVGSTGEYVITHINETVDGGVIVAATINGEDTVVFKLASDGTLSWSRLWSATDSIEKLTAITEDTIGNYILLGATDQLSWPKLDTVLMRLSPSGEFLDACSLFTTTWSDIADLTVTSSSITLTTTDVVPTLAVTSEVGLREIEVTSRSLCATASSDGSAAWSSHAYFANRYTSTSYGDVAASKLVPMTNSYALAGGASLDMKVTLLDSDFYPNWTRMFASSIDFSFGGLVPTQDGGVVLGGSTTSIGAGGSDALVLKLDDTGSRVWGKVLGDKYESTVQAIIPTSDGGVAIVGRSYECGNNWVTSLALKSLPEVRGSGTTVVYDGNIYVFGGQNSGGVLSSVVVYNIASNSWSTKGNTMPNSAWSTAGAVINGKIYVVGGSVSGTPYYDVLREYNPSTDQWLIKASMSSERRQVAVAVVDGKLYVFGGAGWSGSLDLVEMYDPNTNTWVTKTSMGVARYSMSATVVNGKIYVIGGNYLDVVEEYDPVIDTWVTKTPMPTARCYHGAVAFEGKIYVFGGLDNSAININTVEVYDPTNDSWSEHAPLSGIARVISSVITDNKIYIIGDYSYNSGSYLANVDAYTIAPSDFACVDNFASSVTLASLPEARGHGTTVVYDGNIYVFGGQNSGGLLSSVVVYNIASNSWSTKGNTMSDPAWSTAGAVINGKIYVVGGSVSGTPYYDVLREYNPSTDQWLIKASMSSERRQVAVAVVDGKLYVFGGAGWSGSLDLVEMYDPNTNTWVTKTSMGVARYSMSATVVNGKIYVIGGNYLDVVEEYDPVIDTWVTKTPMPTARCYHGAVAFEGKIYVFGGIYSPAFNINTVEVYDPITDTWDLHAPLAGAARMVWSTIIGSKIYVIGGEGDSVYSAAVESYDLAAAEKALITKLGMTGSHAWSKSYLTSATTFNAIFQTSDDGYLALGTTATSTVHGMILQKTDASGVHSWAKTYTGSWAQEGQGIIATTTGYMLWGSSYESDSSYIGIIAKLDTTGNVLWSKEIGSGIATSKVVTGIHATSDNGFLVIASTGDDAVLFKLDSSGVLQWSRVWSTSAEARLSALATETNGDILVLGTTDQFTSPKVETILMRLDSTGSMDGSCVLATSTWSDIADGTLTVASITPTVASITPTVTDAGIDVRAISSEVESLCYRPSVATSLASQTDCCDASIGNAYSFIFDEATFDVSSATTYSATLADGSDLPSWLTFTAGTRSFSGTPTGAATSLAIKVTATDSNGGTATDTFTLSIVGSLTVSNAGGAISYTEDTPYNMPDIEVSTPSTTVTATLTLSDIAAGSLNTATSGSVTSSYNAATGVWEASGAKADVNSLLAGLVFTPASDKSGAFSISVVITDGYSQTASSTITATGVAVNDIPVITQVTKSGTEDTTVTFTASDFTSHYIDVDGDALAGIQVTSLPAHGSLLLDSNPVTINQVIVAADLSKLTLVPEGDWNGTTSFGWQASDGTAYSAANTVSITLSAVNDAPVITQVTKTGTEDAPVTFTASDFTSQYTDVDGDALVGIQVTSLPAHGSLLLDGSAVTLNQVIVAADLGKLTLVPEAEWHGATSFGWQASDGTVYSAANTVSLTLSAVSDVPVITQVTKTGTEDTTVTFTANDFTSHYTDSEGDALANIQITSLPLHGSLLLDGTAVTLNQVIVAGDLSKLTLVPEGDWSGVTSFGWRASDGTAYSAANTVSLTLSAVNDVPVITGVTKTGTEDTTITFTLSDFTSHYTDIDGDALASIQITSLPAHGSFLLDGTAVTLNQVIVAADLSKLTLVPEGEWSGSTSFGWRASDGTAYSTANTVSLSINAVNDRPVLGSNAMYVTQGQTVILTEDMLSATDADTEASTLVFKVSDVTHGRFEIISDPGTGILSFTQQQVASRQVRFVHDASAAAPSYKVVVSDGALETTAAPATVTFAPSQATSTSGNTGDGISLAPIIAGVVGGVVVVGAAVFGVMGYRKWKANKELATNQKVWNFDWHLRPALSRVHGYRLIDAKAVDTQKVVEYYQRCPVPGMDVKSVKIIFTPDQEQGFATKIRLLQEREGRAAFEPKWSQEANAGLRTEVMARLNQMVTPYHDTEYGAVKFVPMWHGTRPEILDSIFKTGYADLSTTDEGFFGKGLYSAYEARYAYKVYSKGALLVNWVTFFSAYPIVDGDMPRLVGKGHYANYDAHFVPVRPRTADPDEVNFYPCIGIHEAVYHEMVVFQPEQCLPRYLVELQPSLPQSPGVMVAISPSMTPQSGTSPEQEQPLAGTSQSVGTNPYAFFMPALSPVASDRQAFRGVPVNDAPAPAVRAEELSRSRGHHHGRHHHSHRDVEMTVLPTEQPSPRV